MMMTIQYTCLDEMIIIMLSSITESQASWSGQPRLSYISKDESLILVQIWS